MSKITKALEAAVATVRDNTPADGERQSMRQRVTADRAFASVQSLLAPRIRHFIRQYGLVGHWDDAEQCCAIGVHRAIQAYDPSKAQFTTFVNWQIRGEMQSLRFRLMTDQRPSARKVDATTVSLHSIATGPDGEDTALEALIEDPEALDATESMASDAMAGLVRESLIALYVEHLRAVGIEQASRRAATRRKVQPDATSEGPRFRKRLAGIEPAELAALEERIAEQKALVEQRLAAHEDVDGLFREQGVSKEWLRAASRRATATLSLLASSSNRFADIHDPHAPVMRRKVEATPLLPARTAPHNVLSAVEAVEPEPLLDAAHAVSEQSPSRLYH